MNDFDGNEPIYVQIIRTIKQNLVSGVLKPGDKLASVRDQAETLKVNPNTVQRAYQELEREGISVTKRGMGSFIAETATLIADLRKEMAKAVVTNYIEGMRALGFRDDDIVRNLSDELAGGKNQ